MKIFVCSTVKDLRDLRDELYHRLKGLGHTPWFSEQDDFPTNRHPDAMTNCIRLTEECDLFVVLLDKCVGLTYAKRKGSPYPELFDLSISEAEYRCARKMGKPVCIFIRKRAEHESSIFRQIKDKNKIEPLKWYSEPAVYEFYDRLMHEKPHIPWRYTFDSIGEIMDQLNTRIGEVQATSSVSYSLPTPPQPYFAHPYPLQKNFTGREKERKELTNWFDKDSNPVFTYIAIGGMGKSALAWYWLTEDLLKKKSPPEGVIWWSFYDKEAGFESFLNHAIEYVHSGESDSKKIESTRDKMNILQSLLSENLFLLVLDGVERVLRAYAGMGSPYQGDEVKEDEKKDFKACIDPNCAIFLQMLAGVSKTKTLITTRICPKDLDDLEGVFCKKLTQMNKADAVEFFKRQGIKGTRAEIEIACESAGYHPLYLRLLSGMIMRDPKNPGDIKEWLKYDLIPELKGKEGHNILELSYDSLDKKKQKFISKISAFRNPMEYDSLLIFNDFGSEKKFNDVLIELTDRGLLLRDEKSNTFDLHPIVRKYCYDRLMDKEGVHSKLRDYFAEIPEPEKVESLDDLGPVIELYHHTVSAGKNEEALGLFRSRLNDYLYYTFGAYQIIIESIHALFPEGKGKLPRLKIKIDQAWALTTLANSYSFSGHPRNAVNIHKTVVNLAEKIEDKHSLTIGLNNLADMAQIDIGELEDAESNLRRSIEISCEINDEFQEAVGHECLGELLTYRGNFEESGIELAKSTKFWKKINDKQGLCLDEGHRTIRFLFMSNTDDALKSAKKCREFAEDRKYERDIILGEYSLGAVYLMKGLIPKAVKHLTDALTRDRTINLVVLEPNILLEFAKLRFQQDRKEEALKFAQEALQITDRSEYRLKQADIHNFLAEFYLDARNLEKAREHSEIAKERAKCGYKPASEKAGKLLKAINSKNFKTI